MKQFIIYDDFNMNIREIKNGLNDLTLNLKNLQQYLIFIEQHLENNNQRNDIKELSNDLISVYEMLLKTNEIFFKLR